MSREPRMLLIVGLISVGGVLALGLLAQRYAKLRPPEVGTALEQVDAFIAARRAMVQQLGSPPAGDGRPDPRLTGELRRVRTREARRAGLTEEGYRRVRDAHRAWRERPQATDAQLAAAFDRRKAELTAVSLGAYEALDE